MSDAVRRPCSDFMDMLRRLINYRIIIIIIIIQCIVYICQKLRKSVGSKQIYCSHKRAYFFLAYPVDDQLYVLLRNITILS